jgi:hypothetical protein
VVYDVDLGVVSGAFDEIEYMYACILERQNFA